MPDLGIGEALTIASLIAGVAGTGASLYESHEASQASSQQQAALKSAQEASANQAAQQKAQAIAAQKANAIQQTGGGLGDTGLSNLSSILAGFGGQAGGANPSPNQAAFSGTNATTTSSPTGLQDAVSQLSGGGGNPNATQNPFSGGFAQNSDSSDPRFQLSQPFA